MYGKHSPVPTTIPGLHHFRVKGLIGKRCLFIDADGVAEKPEGSTSWRNDSHIDVVMTLLSFD